MPRSRTERERVIEACHAFPEGPLDGTYRVSRHRSSAIIIHTRTAMFFTVSRAEGGGGGGGGSSRTSHLDLECSTWSVKNLSV